MAIYPIAGGKHISPHISTLTVGPHHSACQPVHSKLASHRNTLIRHFDSNQMFASGSTAGRTASSAPCRHSIECFRRSKVPHCAHHKRQLAMIRLPHPPMLSTHKRSRSCCADAVVHQAGTESTTSVPQSSVWELDFCSRPLLDERGKKLWELLVCDPEGSFRHSEYFSNNKINSAELRRALEAILSRPGAVKPERCRFFRGQMQTIISKALSEAGIKPLPSRRCFGVMSWLEERVETVYKLDPRYNDKAQTLFSLDLGSPEALPDALRGEQWAFVQLPLYTLQEMLKKVDVGDMFGSGFTLSSMGAADLPKDILIPGVAVFSRRALPLAAWTNGLELAAVKADNARSCLILETGVNQRWTYGAWRATPDSIEEADAWEDAKRSTRGIHFLAVQPDPESEELTGLWLLSDRLPPSI